MNDKEFMKLRTFFCCRLILSTLYMLPLVKELFSGAWIGNVFEMGDKKKGEFGHTACSYSHRWEVVCQKARTTKRPADQKARDQKAQMDATPADTAS